MGPFDVGRMQSYSSDAPIAGDARDVLQHLPASHRFLSLRGSTVGAMAVGDLVRSPKGQWVIVAPTHCSAAGHSLGPDQVLVGHAPCLNCGGHTTWTCAQCDAVTYGPAVGEGCSMFNGPAPVVEPARQPQGELTIEGMRLAAAAAADLDDPQVMEGAWRSPEVPS